MGILIGAKILYKAYEKDLWGVYPSFGIGWDIIDTDVKKLYSDDEEDQYYDIAALNLNIGVSIMHNIFIDDEIGIGINYHFVPYHTDDNYYTSFSSDYFTFNIIYKF